LGVIAVVCIAGALYFGRRSLADEYLDACRTGGITESLLTMSGRVEDTARTWKEFHLWSGSTGTKDRSAKLECPETLLLGKILNYRLVSVAEAEWSATTDYDSTGPSGPLFLKVDQSIWELDKTRTGPLALNELRMVAMKIEGNKVHTETHYGTKRAVYSVELEHSFLTADIWFSDEYVFAADFHR